MSKVKLSVNTINSKPCPMKCFINNHPDIFVKNRINLGLNDYCRFLIKRKEFILCIKSREASLAESKISLTFIY